MQIFVIRRGRTPVSVADALYHLEKLGRPVGSAKDAQRNEAPDEELRPNELVREARPVGSLRRGNRAPVQGLTKHHVGLGGRR